jgi:hypothetical protein
MKLYSQAVIAFTMLIATTVTISSNGDLGFGQSAYAQVSDPQVKAIGDSFLTQLPTSWKVSLGGWEYFDIAKCFTTPGAICYGNNPTTPYGSPTFVDPATGIFSTSFQMNRDEAVVLILRTPPQMRYFSFAQYVVQLANDPTVVFASLSDSLNQLKLGTTGSNVQGVNVFDTYTAVVWTADLNTFSRVKNLLKSSGLPEYAINLLPLPLALPTTTLKMGYGSNAETFNMLMRTALPSVPANFTNYMEEKPFYVLKVGPSLHNAINPAPVIGYASDISGISESSTLQTALNKLVSDIKLKYSTSYELTAQSVQYTTKVGWDCIAGDASCAGDNHDALYSKDTGVIKVNKLDDIVIVAGVNHQKTGQSAYINHSVYDTKKIAGIVSVPDPQLTVQSALYHAGVTDPTDPRAKLYQSLYAYVISYDCTGKQYCLKIPAPTPANPVGLNPKEPFLVVGRAYLNSITKVKPSEKEIIHHQVFFGSKK